MFRRNPNRRDRRAAARGPVVTRTAADAHHVGEIVRVLRQHGVVDLVRIEQLWTSYSGNIEMLTVRHAPRGIQTFTVRADAVLPDDAPDVRHDATECQPRCETHLIEIAAARDNEREAS
jgi:hypothetical protein